MCVCVGGSARPSHACQEWKGMEGKEKEWKGMQISGKGTGMEKEWKGEYKRNGKGVEKGMEKERKGKGSG